MRDDRSTIGIMIRVKGDSYHDAFTFEIRSFFIQSEIKWIVSYTCKIKYSGLANFETPPIRPERQKPMG